MSGFQVCEKRCNECLFGPNKIVSDERKAEVLKECAEQDTFFVCHKTDNTCCRGFYDKDPAACNIMRIAGRLNVVKFVPVEEAEAANYAGDAIPTTSFELTDEEIALLKKLNRRNLSDKPIRGKQKGQVARFKQLGLLRQVGMMSHQQTLMLTDAGLKAVNSAIPAVRLTPAMKRDLGRFQDGWTVRFTMWFNADGLYTMLDVHRPTFHKLQQAKLIEWVIENNISLWRISETGKAIK